MTQLEEMYNDMVRHRFKPTLEDAVRICKMTEKDRPHELFEIFEKLLKDWHNAHNYFDTLD